MKKLKNFWNTYNQQISLGIVVFALAAAVVQFAFGLRYFLSFTSALLSLLAAVALLFWDAPPRKKVLIACIVVVGGFIVEQIGVHTGLIFGNYQYGAILGYRLWGVPITIGITWLIVTLSAWHIVSFGNLLLWQKFLLAGVLAVMFDLILEQFAIANGLWVWQGGEIPFINYVTWFFVSEMFFYGYYRFTKLMSPSIYIAGLLPIMSIFFWLMLLLA